MGNLPAISGTYRGTTATQRLDLRIDLDELKRVSGDRFRVDGTAEIYQESWIIEAPEVSVKKDAVIITGIVRYWNGEHPKTEATVRIPLKPKGAAAAVTLVRQASPPMKFVCKPLGTFFRSLRLEVAVCKSVSAEPTLPKFAAPDRVLTLERVYREAGVELLLHSDQSSIIDDTAPDFAAWTDAELHNAMEHHFSGYKGQWPKWEMWGLVAGLYDDDLVGGVMFDYAGAEGGAGQAPERQGFAIFRNHFWFDRLVATPKTTEELEAARRFLWTFTHESGHAFNLMHSFEKNREDARSWMNYVENYDALHGEGSYWRDFRFSFDHEELLHIRHGNRPSVIMGGDPFSSGGNAEAPPGSEGSRIPPGALTSISGEVPLEILVRAQPYFEFLEPVSIEIRARNLLAVPIEVSKALHPEHGSVTIYVRRPDGRIVEYMPISCKVAPDQRIELSAAGAKDESDKHSRSVFVSYGRYGFYFDEPGQYYVRVVYHGPGNLLIPSNVLRLRVGHPKSEEADRLAQDFFSYESGCALYLGGSHSKFLSGGMDTLRSVIDRQGRTLAGAKTAARIARGVGMPFHDIDDAGGADVVRRRTGGDTKEALALTGVAVDTFRKQPSSALNIIMERVVRTRSDMMLKMGNRKGAYDELMGLAGACRKAKVKPSVVAKLRSDAARIAPRRSRKR